MRNAEGEWNKQWKTYTNSFLSNNSNSSSDQHQTWRSFYWITTTTKQLWFCAISSQHIITHQSPNRSSFTACGLFAVSWNHHINAAGRQQRTYWFTLRPLLPCAAWNTCFTLETQSSVLLQSFIGVITENKHEKTNLPKSTMRKSNVLLTHTEHSLMRTKQAFLQCKMFVLTQTRVPTLHRFLVRFASGHYF